MAISDFLNELFSGLKSGNLNKKYWFFNNMYDNNMNFFFPDLVYVDFNKLKKIYESYIISNNRIHTSKNEISRDIEFIKINKIIKSKLDKKSKKILNLNNEYVYTRITIDNHFSEINFVVYQKFPIIINVYPKFSDDTYMLKVSKLDHFVEKIINKMNMLNLFNDFSLDEFEKIILFVNNNLYI